VAYAVAGGDAAVPTGPAVPSFTDVPADYWAYRYVEYCLAKGITTGYQTGVYGPADTATREQMAAFTSRALAGGDANVPAGPATATFVDVPTDYWAYRYIEYLNQHVVDAAYSTDPMTFEPGLEMSASTAASWLVQATGTQTDPCAARVTDFSAAPVVGMPPLTVAFTDVSRGGPTSWAWDFGDGGTATERSPVHTYTAVGSYTVALTTANTDGLDVKVKQDYIIVALPPVADFLATPLGGPAPLEVAFLDRSAYTPTAWAWAFGDGDESPVRNPRHIYEKPGSYTVSLTVSNVTGASTETKEHYLTVTFGDVPLDSWALQQILACIDAGIVAGYPDGTYRPTDPITRDQMAVYISRALAGGDANVPTGPATATFSDVPTDYWAFKYVEFAAAQSVVQGYSDGTYKPADQVDRGQMAVFIARSIYTPTAARLNLAGYTPPTTATFPDVPTNFWAYKYVEYIAQPDIGVTKGYPDGDYHPEYICTRDQMAVYIQRAFKLPL
jgi:PKD repeat protein